MSIPRATRDQTPESGRGARTGLTLRYALEEPTDRVTRLAWSPDGRSLAVPTRDGVVRLHDAATGRVRLTLRAEPGSVMGVGWSPDSRRLAGIVTGRGTLMWDAETGSPLARDDCDASHVTSVAWSPRGTRLAVTVEEDAGAVHLFDVTGPRPKPTGVLESPGALHAAWHRSGTILAVAARDGAVHRWHAWDRTLLDSDRGHGAAAVHLAWAPSANNAVLASASKDGTIRIHDTQSQGARRVLRAHHDQVRAVAFDPTGNLFASKSRDGTVLLWRTGIWQPVAAITESTAEIGWSVGLAFHPGGRLLATLGEHDAIVRVWDVDVAALSMVPLEVGVREAMTARTVGTGRPAMGRRVRLR